MPLKKTIGFLLCCVLSDVNLAAQSRGLQAIRAADMRTHLEFLSAREFDGRSAPSTALNIASRYLALNARRIGLKPLLPDGSFLQYVPVEVTTLSSAKSRLKVLSGGTEQVFYFPLSFGLGTRTPEEGPASGGMVFVGSALSGPPGEWTKSGLPDLKGKIVLGLEAIYPAGSPPTVAAARMDVLSRLRFVREQGAVASVTIISPEREQNLARKELCFDVAERLRFPDVDTGIPGTPALPRPAVFPQIEVRQAVGAALLELSRADLDAMFAASAQGQPIPAREVSGRTVEIELHTETRKTTTPNVVGWVEGSDPDLKDEYVVISAHHDHNPTREGRVYPGADDDGSGAVAMLSLAEALVLERPKRSVIFVWNTAEERGLIGAYYFVQHCPVPVEKISANLNLDMISRNDPDMIYLIGSNKVSSELDKSIHEMNDLSSAMRLDYTYASPTHPDRFFYRSDQYPYIRYGIPAVWFFCGTTPDYHQETDSPDKADLAKAEKVAKLVYLVCLDIGNKPALLKLDINPEISTRGAHNMKMRWQRPAQ